MRAEAVLMKSTDMNSEEVQEVVEIAAKAMAQHVEDQKVAESVKKELDSRRGGSWNCVVGNSFAAFTTHEAGHFAYFYLFPKAEGMRANPLAFLLFKAV